MLQRSSRFSLDSDARQQGFWFWLVALVAVTLISRWQIFGNPLVGWDEDFYLAVARFMTEGAVPYVDVWDRKPIGIFLIYYPAALVPGWGGVWAFQLMAAAAIVATGLVIMQLARAMGWERGGGWAALLYSVWTILLKGQDGQTPVFYNLLMIGAALLIVRSIPRNGGIRCGNWLASRLVAMVLCGLALQIKYSAIFECVFFGIYLMLAEAGATAGVKRPLQRLVLRTLAYGAAAILPTALVAGWYYAHGHWDVFWQANVLANLERGVDPVAMLARNFAVTLAVIALPLGFALARLRRDGPWERRPAPQRFLMGWLLSAVAGLLFFPPWFDHYALPLLMVVCLACASAFQAHAHQPRRLVGVIVGAALIAQVFIFLRIEDMGRPAQLSAIADAAGKGEGKMFIYRAPHALYWLTGRPAATRFLFNGTLSTSRERPSLGVVQEAEVARIFSVEKPEVVVMRSSETDKRRNEVGAVKTLLLAQLARHYRQTARLRLGRQDVLVYHRAKP